MIGVMIVGEYIAAGRMKSRAGELILQRDGSLVAGGCIMGGGADGQLIDRDALVASQALVVDIQFIDAGG